MWWNFTNSRFPPQRLSDSQFSQQCGLFLMWRHSLPQQRERFHLRRSLQQLHHAGRRRWKEEKVAGGEWVRLRLHNILSGCGSLFSQRTRRWRRFEDLIWFAFLVRMVHWLIRCHVLWPLLAHLLTSSPFFKMAAEISRRLEKQLRRRWDEVADCFRKRTLEF